MGATLDFFTFLKRQYDVNAGAQVLDSGDLYTPFSVKRGQ